MLPNLSIRYVVHRLPANAEGVCYIFMQYALRAERSDLYNFLSVEFSISSSFAVGVPIFLRHIRQVIALCTAEKMGRIDAPGVVALMAYHHICGQLDLVFNFVRNSMGIIGFPFKRDRAISQAVFASLPLPTCGIFAFLAGLFKNIFDGGVMKAPPIMPVNVFYRLALDESVFSVTLWGYRGFLTTATMAIAIRDFCFHWLVPFRSSAIVSILLATFIKNSKRARMFPPSLSLSAASNASFSAWVHSMGSILSFAPSMRLRGLGPVLAMITPLWFDSWRRTNSTLHNRRNTSRLFSSADFIIDSRSAVVMVFTLIMKFYLRNSHGHYAVAMSGLASIYTGRTLYSATRESNVKPTQGLRERLPVTVSAHSDGIGDRLTELVNGGKIKNPFSARGKIYLIPDLTLFKPLLIAVHLIDSYCLVTVTDRFIINYLQLIVNRQNDVFAYSFVKGFCK